MRKVLLSFIALLLVAIAYAAPAVITEQPEGELKTYLRSGSAYENFFGLWEEKQDGNSTQLVFAEDGKTVYWKNPLTLYTKDSWIKGELNADGTKIVFPAGQYLYYDEAKEYGYRLVYIKNIVFDGYYYESFDVDDTTPITLAVDGNILTLEGTNENGTTVIASVTDDDEPSWNYYGDYQTVLTLFEAIPVVAPEGLETSTFTFRYGTNSMRIVNVGVSGDELYIQGIYSGLPDAWVKGTIEGNTVTVKSGQYMGEEKGVMLYWVASTLSEVWNDYWEEYDKVYTYADQMTFLYDPETGAYSSDMVLLANNGETEINRYGTFASPVLTPYQEVAATPADPEIDDFYIPEDDEDEGSVTFYIYAKDVEGNDLNPDNIYYRLYINDDELYTLTTDNYEYLSEDMSEFGYSFTDDWDFSVNTSTGKHKIYLYSTFERIGVQVIYRAGGEERASNIVYSDGRTTETAIENIPVQSGEVRAEYYDLCGRRTTLGVQENVVIERTVDTNGIVKVRKILKK
ncbi:MAG: hypothetical protein NC206_08040 [Bacteroides sp.]|nr:hypothetical protein [Roseburia sp.]MCM1347019.1 hypothetical protein [Bacteroides sp.]MCM1421538.1 hypothetical protein [Bacteroides sp.]